MSAQRLPAGPSPLELLAHQIEQLDKKTDRRFDDLEDKLGHALERRLRPLEEDQIRRGERVRVYRRVLTAVGSLFAGAGAYVLLAVLHLH